MLILKDYVEAARNNIENKSKILYDYGLKLKEMGWIENMMEGCFISPDFSTCFVYNRSPYYGELQQYNRDNEAYLKIKSQLEKDFIEL